MRRNGRCIIGVSALAFICFLQAAPIDLAPGVVQLGTIQNISVTESSGLAPSRRSRGFYWTHNDGDRAVLYAITTNGAPGGDYQITGADLHDWEDIASAGGRIYIADIGNNTGTRDNVDVYYVSEPRANRSGQLPVRKHWTLHYPDQPFDAESFFVASGYGYIVSKELNGGEASLYRFRLGRATEVDLQKQCRLNVNAPPAGADITADRRRLAVITDEGAYLFQFLRGRIPADGKIEPAHFTPFPHARMEGCCFTRGGLLVTAENGDILLFTDAAFRSAR